MLAPEPEKKSPRKEEMKKTEKPEKKTWKPFLVVDHNLRPQGYFNDSH